MTSSVTHNGSPVHPRDNWTLDDLAQQVTDALIGVGGKARPRELISQLQQKTGAPEPAILNAIWRLVERRRVELTPDLLFEVVQERDRIPA